jgi:ABC-type uncharacterized transport system involved in gliding motility auxiliary subunit
VRGDKKMKSKKVASTAIGFGVILLGILALNVISSKLSLRMDVTEDNIFTLSEGTKNILGKLDKDIQVKFYFSRTRNFLL